MFSQKLIRPIALGIAAVIVGAGAYAIVDSSTGNSGLGTASAATSATGNSANFRHADHNRRVVGQIPKNWRPGAGTIITGAAANKAKAAALAKYPGGTVNRVLKFSDGSYAVKYIKISWPHHVFVSKNFKVTGALG